MILLSPFVTSSCTYPHIYLLVVRRVQGEAAQSVQLMEDLPVSREWLLCQAQVHGFSNNSYRGYQTLEEASEEFNQFLADEAMAYQDMDVQALPSQEMALQAMPVEGMPTQALPVQGMPAQAMPLHDGHRFRT
jgi:hypothetical protein